jgi:hypothetical protein
MNTFFRICVIMCIGLLVFTLSVNYIQSTGAFDVGGDTGLVIDDTGDILDKTTELDAADANMDFLWQAILGGVGIGIGVAAGARFLGVNINATLLGGLSVFATVFWASYIKTHGILMMGDYLPAEYTIIFTGGALFIFIAAMIGMLTGSG